MARKSGAVLKGLMIGSRAARAARIRSMRVSKGIESGVARRGCRTRLWRGGEGIVGGEAATGFEGVDFGGGFVGANAGDAGKTEREAAVVAGAGLDAVEGDFEHGVGHDAAE